MIVSRWHYPVLAVFMLAGLWALWPRTPELATASLRAGQTDAAIGYMEAELDKRPQDAGLALELSASYEQAGKLEAALTLVDRAGRVRPLTGVERDRARRLALAVGAPRRALAYAAQGAENPTDAQLKDLVDLALMAEDLPAARRYQARLAASGAPQAVARARDLALMGQDLAGAIAAQRTLASVTRAAADRDRLVDLLVQAGDTAGALDAIEAQPGEDAAYHRRAAQLAEWAQAPARALPHLEALYALAPDAALGARLLAASPAGERLALARRLASDFPQDAAIAAALDYHLLRAGRVDEALARAQARAAAAPDDATAHRALISLALGHGRRALAVEALERWTRRHPQDAEAAHQLAQVLVWDGRSGEAWGRYQALLDSGAAPRSRELAWRAEWAAISAPLDDWTDAGRDNLEALVGLKPADASLTRRLAGAMWERGETEPALAAQRRLAERAGADPKDAMRLAEWLLWKGRLDEAFTVFVRQHAKAPLPQPVLLGAAYEAAAAERWSEAARFYALAAEQAPKDPLGWAALARELELAGDLPGAVKAWQRRLALKSDAANERLHMVHLMMRLGRPAEALALLEREAKTLDEWRALSSLAYDRQRPAVQTRALEAILALAPEDLEALVALADMRDRAGDGRAADALYARALAIAPDDATLLTRVAAGRFYGGRPAEAAPLLARLADREDLGPDGWRLIADAYEDQAPRRAASALDRLHADGQGDAGTYLRRGDLAKALGASPDSAWKQAAESPAPTPELAEAKAWALSRLGRQAEALSAWQALAAAHPQRVGPVLALAQHHLASREPALAAPLIARARAIAPDSFDVRLAHAEWLQASGEPQQALDAFRALKRERPGETYLAIAEANALAGLERFRSARAAIRPLVADRPHDADLLGFYRGLRDEGAHRVGPVARHEQSSAVESTALGLGGTWRLTDALSLTGEAARLNWGGAAPSHQQATFGLGWRQGPWRLEGDLALADRDGAFGGLAASWRKDGLTVRAGLSERRWDDAGAAVSGFGRERQAEATVSLTPDPRLTVQATAGLGRLALAGADVGGSGQFLGEAAIRPWADGPWAIYYQYWHRRWGQAGALVGLPEAVDVHSALLGYAARRGPWRVELQPGYAWDARMGQGAPTVGGTLALEWGPDAELSLTGAWSGRALAQGAGGEYRRVALSGTWWF